MIELMLPPFVACLLLVAIHSYLGCTSSPAR